MTTAIATVNGAATDPLAGKIDLIKETVAKGASDIELELFLHQCRRSGLDPLARQIYCIKRQGRMSIETGIDGYRLIADRTDRYAGNEDAVFEEDANGKPLKATVTVWKIVQGQRCAFTATARIDEYQPTYDSNTWKKMPHVMLAKCAEALALRKAFPAELSGIYTAEEMDQAGEADMEQRTPSRPPQRQQSASPRPQPEPVDGQASMVDPDDLPFETEPPTPSLADNATLKRLLAAGEAVQMDSAAITEFVKNQYNVPSPRKLTQQQAEAVIARWEAQA